MPNIFDLFRKKNNIPDNEDVCIPVINFEKFKDSENKVTYEKIISMKSTEQFKELFFKGKNNDKCIFNAPKDHLIIVPNLQSNLKKHMAIFNYNIIYQDSKIIYKSSDINKSPSNDVSIEIAIPELVSASGNWKNDNLIEKNKNEYLYSNINQIEIIYKGLSADSFIKGYFEYYIIPKIDADKIFYTY